MSSPQTIPERQNSSDSLQLLAAASQFYSNGKIALAAQFSLTVGLAIVLSITALVYPPFKIWAAFTAITVTWLDVAFIDRIQIYFRKRGALVQEELDCKLFRLTWNELRCGKALEPEEIHRAASRFLGSVGDSKLRDWYPAAAGTVDLPFGRLICQRACLWWDTSQRRVYAYWLIGTVAAALILLVGMALVRAQSVQDFILATYAPLAPAIIWSARESRRQRDAADGLDKTRSFVDGVWNHAVAGSLSGENLHNVSRQIQDAIFEGRSKNPLIFNWIYRFLRSDRELAMGKAAEKLSNEINTNL